MIATASNDVVEECSVINGGTTKSIAQRLADLQKSGSDDWTKRVSRFIPEKEIKPYKINEAQELLKNELMNGFKSRLKSPIGNKNDSNVIGSPELVQNERKKDLPLLADRKERLETATSTWKARVEPSDAVKFSVVGKMASLSSTPPKQPHSPPSSELRKRIPHPTRFQSFREPKRELKIELQSPEKSKSSTSLNRNSAPDLAVSKDEDFENGTLYAPAEKKTVVHEIYDKEFSTFFKKLDNASSQTESHAKNIADLDLEFMKLEKPNALLQSHKKIKVQRKHVSKGNPLKNISKNIEIKNEYREFAIKVPEKDVEEKRRIDMKKFLKTSSLAVEALAGLASKEDFAKVKLKKTSPLSGPMLPYKSLMLLHIKGRRHVQTRLVEPVFESVNSGDSYILITPNEIFHWVGEFSNVIERSRGAEIAQRVLSSHDLGCSGATSIITISEEYPKVTQKHIKQFWTLLGVPEDKIVDVKAINAGHPDEDEMYESSLILTNMIYEVEEDELVPAKNYWASLPKIQMLDPNKVLVFDFGTEFYVWMGKNVDMNLRKSSIKLAKELWDNGFNYMDCDLCPITSTKYIGNRLEDTSDERIKNGKKRPEWCLFAKVTQNMETILFREKFFDWPDFSRVIRTKGKKNEDDKEFDTNFELKPANVEEMLNVEITEPDLVLENGHLGRGSQYFDNERKLFCTVTTVDVLMWHVFEFDYELVKPESMGQFFSTDSYVIKWVYSISYTGRELNGQPSKHTTMGRDRLVYFYWQGKNASLNEKGAAALLTIELDEEKGTQMRVCQGYEPPAFFNLFQGKTIIYKNKENFSDQHWRLFICRGELESEAQLWEVSCNIKQLRSRASFVLINKVTGVTFLWHGSKVLNSSLKVTKTVVRNLAEHTPSELGLKENVIMKVDEIREGNEPKEFFTGLGGSNRKLYYSLLENCANYDTSPVMYSLINNEGILSGTPVLASCRHKNIVTPYPFLQDEIYSVTQPALFLIDSGQELWLWQGWWPERESNVEGENTSSSDEGVQNVDKDRGSACIRWQMARRAAMQTAIDYWKRKYDIKPLKAYLVWAGLEPIQFTNLFPDWQDRDDVAEMNMQDGRKPGGMIDIEQELERLTQSTYPIEQLLQRPLPEGVDPTKLELYLSPSHFEETLNMTKDEFAQLPLWKQTNLKKNAGLF